MLVYRVNIILCAVLALKLQYFVKPVESYILADPVFEVLKPRGIRVSIPDEPRLQFFAFHGNVNKGITENQVGEISGEVHRAKDGRWTVENSNVYVKDGDVIHYWIYAQADGSSYKKIEQSWTVVCETQEIPTSTERVETSTMNLLFEENFDSLNKSVWGRDIKMPFGPDYEFCVYHNENHQFLVQTENGILKLKPLILEDYYGENATAYGRLQLGGCTSTIPVECMRQAVSYSILPPIISSRLNTKESFSFQYGKIEIRAKFPEGDWLYPEMWLEPKYSSYGPDYASGRVLLGLSRGNENLINVTDRSIYDSRKLDFGLRVGSSGKVNEYIVSKIRETSRRWTQDFHVYTTIWNTNGFQFLVDGEQVGYLNSESNGWLPPTIVNAAGKPVPFDQEFYITLGVGVGGIRVFPDGTMSSGHMKPWRNVGAKAMLKFWHARNDWLSSWRRENGRKTVFEIDYIRVWSFPS